MNPTDVLRATYVLDFTSKGADTALAADKAVRDAIAKTTDATVAATKVTTDSQTKMSAAWIRTAEIATKAQNDVAKQAAAVSIKVDAAVTKQVASLRRQGVAYDAIAAQMKAYGVEADAAAAAIERNATREEVAMSRVAEAQKKREEYGTVGYAGQRTYSAGRKTAQFGEAVSKMSLPVAGVMYEAIKQASDYQQQLTLLQTQAGAHVGEVKKLNGELIAMGNQMGQSATDLATGMYHVQSEGLHGADALKTLHAAAVGAKVGNSDLELTTNALVSTMKDLHAPASDASAVMGGLNSIVGAGNMRMTDLVGVLGKLLPSARGFGLGLKDVGASLDTMTRLGYNTATASTSLRMMFSQLGGGASKQAKAVFEDLGTSSSALALDMHKPNGILIAVKDLKSHLDKTGEAAGLTGNKLKVFEATAISQAFGGGRSSAGIMAMIQNTQDLQKNLNGLGNQTTWSGKLQSAFETTEQTSAARFERMKSEVTNSLISLGETLGPIILPPLAAITKAITGALNWFSKIPGPVKTAALAFTGIVVALGPLTYLFGNVMKVGGGLMKLLGKILPGPLGGRVKALSSSFTDQKVAITDVNAAMEKLAAAQTEQTAQAAELAKSNTVLADSYKAVADAAGEAALAEDATGAGGGLGKAAGAASEAESGAGRAATAVEEDGGAAMKEREAQSAISATSQYGVAGEAFGTEGGREIAAAAGTAAESGGITAAETGAAGAAAIATKAAVPEAASLAGDAVEDGGGVLSRASGLLSGAAGMGGKLIGGAGVAGIGLLGTQIVSGLASKLLGKGTGSAVKAIGTDASIGAGIGSIVPGVGTVVGGVAGGAIGAIGHFGSSLFGGNSAPSKDLFDSKQQIQQIKLNAQKSKLQADLQENINSTNEDVLRSLQMRANAALQDKAISSQQADKITNAVAAQGLAVAAPALKSTQQAIASSQFKPGANAIAASTEKDLAGLPARAQREGAEAMVQFTAGLEQNKQLPVGSTNKLIDQLDNAYGPQLQQRLTRDSSQSMQVISDQIDQSNVIASVQAQADKIHQIWGIQIPNDTKITAGNFVDTIGGDMDSLTQIIKNSTGQQHDTAVAAYAKLRADAGNEMTGLVTDTVAKQNSLSSAIASGSGSAAAAATQNFQALASNITSSMQAGITSTAQGSAEIAKALNSTLKAFGAKPVPVAVSVAQLQSAANSATGNAKFADSKNAQVAALAQGGRVPGPVGPDNWMLVDPSGQPAAMVGGSELLIANRHTESRVDSMLAHFGTSLGAEVNGETRMHSFATGGRLKQFATGGALSYSAIEGAWVQAGGPPAAAATAAAITGAESSFNPRAVQAGQPYGSTGWGLWQITPGNSEPQYGVDDALFNPLNNAEAAVAKYKTAPNGGNNFSPWTTYVDGAYKQFLQGGVAASTSTLAGGVSAALAKIAAPKVSGDGTAAQLARSSVGKMTNAADAYLAKIGALQGGSGSVEGAVSLLPGAKRALNVKGGSAGVQKMIAEANAIASHNYNYEWGGGHGDLGVPTHGTGHGSGPGVGFDCSGSVSAVLGADGLVHAPMVAQDYMTWGDPGPGQFVSIFASPSHVFMSLDGHYFGTSTAYNPGGGANWIPTMPESMPATRHPKGYATGGRVGSKQTVSGGAWKLDPTQLPTADQARLRSNPNATLPGLATGGRLMRAATGGQFMANAYADSGGAAGAAAILNGTSASTTSSPKPTERYVNHVPVGKMTTAQWNAYQLAHPKAKASAKPTAHYDSKTHKLIGYFTEAAWQAYLAAHPKAVPKNEHWNPFTNQYQALTSAQVAALRNAYIKKYGKTPPTGPKKKSSSSKQTVASILAGTATQLPTTPGSSFDLGYQYGLDPTSGGVSPLQALNAALTGMSAAGTGAYGGPLGSLTSRLVEAAVPNTGYREQAVPGPILYGAGASRGRRIRTAVRRLGSDSASTKSLTSIHRGASSGHGLKVRGVSTGHVHSSPYHGPSKAPGMKVGGGDYNPLPHDNHDWTLDPSDPYHANYTAGAAQAASHLPGSAYQGVAAGLGIGSVDAMSYGAPGSSDQGIVAAAAVQGRDDVLSAEVTSAGAPNSYVQRHIVGNHTTLKAATGERKDLRGIAAGGKGKDGKKSVDDSLKALDKSISNVSTTSYGQLDTLQKSIESSIKKSKGKGSGAEKKRLEQALSLVDYQMGQRTGMLVKQAEDQATALQTASTQLQNSMSRQAISTTSAQGAKMLADFDKHAADVLQGTVDQLQQALKMAQESGDSSAISDITDKLTQAQGQLDQAVTDSITANYAAIQAAAQQVVDNGTKGEGAMQDAQTIAGTAGTQAAQQALGSYISGTVIPSLQTSLTSLQNQLVAAQTAGDTGLTQTLEDSIQTTSSALAQATSDSRTALEAAAADAVSSSQNVTSNAQSGETQLSSLQALTTAGASTAQIASDEQSAGIDPTKTGPIAASGTPQAAQQMATYITSQIVPALQGELGALQGQEATAKAVGDSQLADQIATAIQSKQQDILQAQLDAQQAIADATAQTAANTSDLEGGTGFSFQNQNYTDNLSFGVGA